MPTLTAAGHGSPNRDGPVAKRTVPRSADADATSTEGLFEDAGRGGLQSTARRCRLRSRNQTSCQSSRAYHPTVPSTELGSIPFFTRCGSARVMIDGATILKSHAVTLPAASRPARKRAVDTGR